MFRRPICISVSANRVAVRGTGHTGNSAVRRLWLILAALFLLPISTLAIDSTGSDGLRVVIVGGGPDPNNNQVAIESNVRYVCRLLPRGTVRTMLFADGNLQHATVLYDDDPKPRPVGERVLALALEGHESGSEVPEHFRRPRLGGKLDGPSKKSEIERVFTELSGQRTVPSTPVVLYFTGHGSSNHQDNDNNVYDLWGPKEALSVRELAAQIRRLPEETPVTVVMVQCFSGAFGNLIFEGGDPKGDVTNRDIAGFYATVKERVAAGCTSAVNEAEYHDFTSYFFAALTGRDRLGRVVTGADYNKDGRVGMDEAFCYTLIHDESIDIPVCSSDVFLRRFVLTPDADVFRTPYASVRAWATPAQRVALEALSARLNLSGENRLEAAFQKMMSGDGAPAWVVAVKESMRRLNNVREESKRAILGRWPDLRLSPSAAAYRAARQEAVTQLTDQVGEGKWMELFNADDAVDKSEKAGEASEIAESHMVRFIRLGKSVVLAHRLKETGDAATRARYARLIASEARTLLPPVAHFDEAGLP